MVLGPPKDIVRTVTSERLVSHLTPELRLYIETLGNVKVSFGTGCWRLIDLGDARCSIEKLNIYDDFSC